MPISSKNQIEIQLGQSLPGYVTSGFAEYGDAVAMVDEDGKSMTYSELQATINKVATALTQKGIKQGDCVMILSPNDLNYPAAYHGILSIGAIATTCNPAYTAHEVGHQLKDSKAVFAFGHASAVGTLQEAGVAADKIVCLSGDAPEGSNIVSFATFTNNDGKGAPKVDIKGSDIAALPYSSGTTGLSKGVMLTHDNIVANLQQAINKEGLDFTRSDCVMTVLPFYHIYGQVVMMNSALNKGSELVIMSKFDPGKFLTLTQTQKVTVLPIVPPIVLFLAKHPIVAKFDLSSVHTILSGAAPLGAEQAAECKARFKHIAIRHGYGMTELSPVSHISPPGSEDNGFCLVANTTAKIMNVETGEEAKEGERGELWVKGSQVMKGYLNNEEATKNTIDSDGFLHTGDIAYVNAEGKFYVVDRLKELIKYKGFQVPPAELEALLLSHPAIADCACIPIPDERAGELPKAFVVLKPEQKLSEEEVKEFVKSKLADYKRLRGGVEFMDKIPKSASGKILRRVLRDAEAKKRGYKLTYFDIPGRGEAIRIAFRLGGIEFEDNRVSSSWKDLKPTLEFGSVPILDHNGKRLTESNVILSFIGSKAGLVPTDSLQSALCQEILAKWENLSGALSACPNNAEARGALVADTFPIYLDFLERRLAESGGPFLLGAKPTIADIKVYCGALALQKGIFDHVPVDVLTKREALAGLLKAFETFCDSKNLDVRPKKN